jgi:GrpB-like predicted nucleotidyltransferase (UPF0157 family)
MNSALDRDTRWPATVGPATLWPASAQPSAPAFAVVPWQPSWSGRFRVEAEVLRAALEAFGPQVEHIGGTAVTGLSARPIIDLLVAVDDPGAVRAQSARLANFGYITLPEAPQALVRPRLMRHVRGLCSHHVYVVARRSALAARLLLWRDLLRADPGLLVEYDMLKRRLAAQQPNDEAAYHQAKVAFIQATLGLAR